MRHFDPDDPLWNEDDDRAAARQESLEDWKTELAGGVTGDDTCINCNGPSEGYSCDHCEELCCEACLVYVETAAATRLQPDEGVYMCPDCLSNIEADRAEWEIAAAEQRAEERALDREWEDRNRW
jgi:hypothetical protein